MRKNTTGFTIVELLIVIVVIAILAAISIVAYTGIQNRAHDSAVQSDLRNFARQVAAFHAVQGRYPTLSQFFNGTVDMRISVTKSSYDTRVYNLYYCTDVGTGERFGIAARSKSGQTFTISSTSGIAPVTGAPSWGVACGAFGESVLANITFDYGYAQPSDTWRGNL